MRRLTLSCFCCSAWLSRLFMPVPLKARGRVTFGTSTGKYLPPNLHFLCLFLSSSQSPSDPWCCIVCHDLISNLCDIRLKQAHRQLTTESRLHGSPKPRSITLTRTGVETNWPLAALSELDSKCSKPPQLHNLSSTQQPPGKVHLGLFQSMLEIAVLIASLVI
jgi:hypothetical protein